MGYLLGIDLGSSSVKVALVDADDGRCAASAHYPKTEAPIASPRPGWAEQSPDDWWLYTRMAVAEAMAACGAGAADVSAIGISYQMHGLVCLDAAMQPVRDAIIWCDSRAVPFGEAAWRELGSALCLDRLLGSPGNFTAAKLAWVKANQPGVYERIRHFMLPGDYLALRLTGVAATTACGLSEMTLWDYREEAPAGFLMSHYGFDPGLLPPLVPTFGEQGVLTAGAAAELGLKPGTPVTYRAGDQPNNALSLAVLEPGEVASTAGTSGVVYGIAGGVVRDPLSRVNTFLHVNHTPSAPRLGVMHCVGGCGILNSWLRRNVAKGPTYDDMNQLAASVPAGSEGLVVVPFGNGAERVLENRTVGCSVHGLDFNRHSQAHLLRASQEGVAFSLCLGMEVMQGLGMRIESIHAGRANLFLSPVFRSVLAATSGATVELYDTDGAVGAARGAGLGAGIYSSAGEAFASLRQVSVEEPLPEAVEPCREAYERWKRRVEQESEACL
ncbi:MAG: carbohydrate kinase [Bacteroidales bacterium]|nr:carbohydrate kinase [Bacteroidales bacterium]